MSMLASQAVISDCGMFRYSLRRQWGSGPGLVFIMLNPSTADATLDDPTIRRCMGFARREGRDGILVMNLYAYRATDPGALSVCDDPVGPQNDAHLRLALAEQVRLDSPVVAAWGANGGADRAREVLQLVPGTDWRCLGLTKAGSPRHPLYVRADQPLVPLLPSQRSRS